MEVTKNSIDFTKNQEKERLRKKVIDIHDYLQRSYYINPSNISIDSYELNDVILWCLLTPLVSDGKILLIGNPGLGKTTLAEAVLSLVYSLPVEVYADAKLEGHPEQTQEKAVGRPDLAELNQGKEVVKWTLFTLIPGKIIDEANRLPPGKQSELLNAIDRGEFKYLDRVLFEDSQPFFATANYPDEGNSPLIRPLADRFDVMVEVRSPIFVSAIVSEDTEEERNKLSDSKLAEKIITSLLSMNSSDKIKSYEDVENFLKSYRYEFAKGREDLVLLPEELEEIRKQIKKIKLSDDAKKFLEFVGISSRDPYSGEKRPGELLPTENHYKDYLPGKIKSGLSTRLFKSLVKYAKGIAWLRGHEYVEIEDLVIVFPYALAHRVEFDETYLQAALEERNDIENVDKSMIQLYAAKKLARELYDEFERLRDKIEEALRYAKKGEIDKLKALAKEIDHPFFIGLYSSLIIPDNSIWGSYKKDGQE